MCQHRPLRARQADGARPAVEPLAQQARHVEQDKTEAAFRTASAHGKIIYVAYDKVTYDNRAAESRRCARLSQAARCSLSHRAVRPKSGDLRDSSWRGRCWKAPLYLSSRKPSVSEVIRDP